MRELITEWWFPVLFAGWPWLLYLGGYPDAAILAAVTMIAGYYIGKTG